MRLLTSFLLLPLLALACNPLLAKAETSLAEASSAEAANISLQLNRVDYALQSIDLIKKDWPWLSAEGVCIVLTDLTAQYLLLCEPPADSPYQVSGLRFRQQPVYINRSPEAVLGSQHAPYADFAKSLVGTVMVYHPAQAALTGFAKDKPWIIMTSLEALQKWHPAFDASTRTEDWLSIFAHEFFHTRQFLQPAAYQAWGKILTHEINPENLNQLYRSEPNYRAQIDKEYQALVAAVESKPSPTAARQALRDWLQHRQQRIQQFSGHYPGNLDQDEITYLYIEGVARYLENVYTVSASQQPPAALLQDPRFRAFADSIGQGYAGMWNRQIPQGKYYYALGLHLGLLLDRIDPSWTQTVHLKPRWLLDSVTEASRP